MTNAEHLIENAICCIENGETYEDFSGAWYNKVMAEENNIDLDQVFQMAIYIVYTVKQIWVSDTVAYFQNRELFDDKMKEYIKKLI